MSKWFGTQFTKCPEKSLSFCVYWNRKWPLNCKIDSDSNHDTSRSQNQIESMSFPKNLDPASRVVIFTLFAVCIVALELQIITLSSFPLFKKQKINLCKCVPHIGNWFIILHCTYIATHSRSKTQTNQYTNIWPISMTSWSQHCAGNWFTSY